jgi:GNAT superfamily N-acetyltransferase
MSSLSSFSIERLDAAAAGAAIPALAELLVDAVHGGASVGFDGPFDASAAAEWWRGRIAEVEAGALLLLGAREEGRLVGTVQIVLASYPNGRHRAEVAKLLVHSSRRRRGIARALMSALEAEALAAGRTLLILDTETGSDAERLYERLGWTRFGVVPGHAYHPHGGRRPTTFFYKELPLSA